VVSQVRAEHEAHLLRVEEAETWLALHEKTRGSRLAGTERAVDPDDHPPRVVVT